MNPGASRKQVRESRAGLETAPAGVSKRRACGGPEGDKRGFREQRFANILDCY